MVYTSCQFLPHLRLFKLSWYLSLGGTIVLVTAAPSINTAPPSCYTKAIAFPEWRHAIEDEFNALVHNGTWVLVPPSPNENIISCK